MDVNKTICIAQQKAAKVADAFSLGIDCGPNYLCAHMVDMWASRLLDESCDDYEKVRVFLQGVNPGGSYTTPTVVTTDCTITYEDVTPQTSCTPITYTVIK